MSVQFDGKVQFSSRVSIKKVKRQTPLQVKKLFIACNCIFARCVVLTAVQLYIVTQCHLNLSLVLLFFFFLLFCVCVCVCVCVVGEGGVVFSLSSCM